MRLSTRHLLFWIAIYFVWAYMKSSSSTYTTYMLVNLVNVPIYMMAYYYLKLKQIPRYFNQGKILLFVLSLLMSSIVLYTIWRINGELWIDQLRGFRNIQFMSVIDFMTQTVQFYSPAMALLVWDSFYEKKKEEERIQQLEKEKLSTELKFLKAQLNPHFLFNTLNNLYSFVINGSPQAPDMILRLSGILDYVLYKSQYPSVPLKDEIKAIENFISLEKIRYGNRLEVNYDWQGDMETGVSPLLLLSIVENAFKHGASGDIEQPKIDVNIQEEQGIIQCSIWNTKSNYSGEINDAYKEGIGMSNIRRQLDLVYPEHHDLVIQDNPHEYKITVKIKTNS